MNELKDIKISIISLVGKAANGRVVICKSNQEAKAGAAGQGDVEKIFKIKKQNTEKHKLYGIVYSPVGEDSDGDYMSSEEIEKGSDNFMMQLQGTDAMDVNHNLIINPGLNIVENWIVRKGDSLFPDEAGAWAIGVKVNDMEIWDKVQKGELTGFSMYGEAIRVTGDIQKGSETIFEKGISEIKEALNKFINIFKKEKMEDTKKVKIIKDFNSLVNSFDIENYIYTLRDAVRQINEDSTITDKMSAINESIDQFKAKLASVTVAKKLVKEVMKSDGEVDIEKAGKMISDDNLAKLQTAMDAIDSIIAAAAKQPDSTGDTAANDTAVKSAVKKATEELNAEIEKSKKELEEVKKEYEELKKRTNGSGQEIETEVNKQKKYNGINWIPE